MNKVEFIKGQKVKCVYYHEYEMFLSSTEKCQFKRPFIQRLLDKPFSPVKFGIVVGSAGLHPYWLSGGDGKEEYMWVKFKEYRFKKAIPISCIYDAIESEKRDEQFLNDHKNLVGRKGFSFESFVGLSKMLSDNKEFIK